MGRLKTRKKYGPGLMDEWVDAKAVLRFAYNSNLARHSFSEKEFKIDPESKRSSGLTRKNCSILHGPRGPRFESRSQQKFYGKNNYSFKSHDNCLARGWQQLVIDFSIRIVDKWTKWKEKLVINVITKP